VNAQQSAILRERTKAATTIYHELEDRVCENESCNNNNASQAQSGDDINNNAIRMSLWQEQEKHRRAATRNNKETTCSTFCFIDFLYNTIFERCCAGFFPLFLHN
jgi:hypothetical protein